MISYPSSLARSASIVAVAALMCLPFSWARGSADPCAPNRTAGVDISEWDDAAYGYFGRAVVQTFFAEDTLITAITVWRVATENNYFDGIYVYVGETDSTGMPLTDHILARGSTLDKLGDGISPAAYRYEFSPPLAVPRGDTIAAYFVSEPCDNSFNLYMAKDTQYTGGSSEDVALGRTLWAAAIPAASPRMGPLLHDRVLRRRDTLRRSTWESSNSATDERSTFVPATALAHATHRKAP
jgi:hypothetical protein